MRDPGYPDWIHQYDHVPGSPFYNDPDDRKIKCLECSDIFDGENDMHYINLVDDDEGVCKECAEKESVKADWGF